MASGCILGKCIKCNGLVWEDDEFIFADNNNISHFICPDNELFTEAQIEYLNKYYIRKDDVK